VHTIIKIALNTKVFPKSEGILSFDFKVSHNFIRHIVLYRKNTQNGNGHAFKRTDSLDVLTRENIKTYYNYI